MLPFRLLVRPIIAPRSVVRGNRTLPVAVLKPAGRPGAAVLREGSRVRTTQIVVTAAASTATEPSLGRLGRTAQRLAQSNSSLAFLGRWALYLRKFRRTRLAIRAVRTAVLCAVIYRMGEAHGMMKYAADPEGEADKNLIAIVHGTVGDGSDKSRMVVESDHVMLPKGHPMHERAAGITARLLSAAVEVMQAKAGEQPVQMQHKQHESADRNSIRVDADLSEKHGRWRSCLASGARRLDAGGHEERGQRSRGW